MHNSNELFDADLSDAAAAEILGKISIPPCPAIVLALLEESRREDLDFNKIGRLIGGDVALAAAVLKTANSPFFALRRKVQSVQQAAAVLGLRNLLKIVYGFALRQSLGRGSMGLENFWDRSNYNAVVTSYLAARWPAVSADDAYTFGLFHDVGLAVMEQQHADYKDLLTEANRSGGAIVSMELERYHTTHVMVGALLARNWYLSDDVVWAIRYHHDYSVYEGTHQRASAAVRHMVALGAVSEHLVARFLEYPEDAEWEFAAQRTVAYLGMSRDAADALLDGMADDLEEIRGYRE